MKAALEADDDVNAFTKGVTKARFKVNFNGWVESIAADADATVEDGQTSQLT